jgi:hypothetical protein
MHYTDILFLIKAPKLPSVSIVQSVKQLPVGWTIRVQFPVGDEICHHHHDHMSSSVHSASCIMGGRGSFLGDKAF